MPINSIVVIRAFKHLFESDWAEAVTALKCCIVLSFSCWYMCRVSVLKGSNLSCRQTRNLGGSGQLASGSGRGTSPGSTAPSTPISGLRPSSQSWKLSEMQPGDEPSPWSPKPIPPSSPTISQPLLDSL